jgi:hypothetical protein
MIDAARKERLTKELRQAELDLDALSRSKDPGKMRTQQSIAGQRAKVYGLRVELLQIEIDGCLGTSDAVVAKRQELRADRCDLSLRIKEAELSARAASKQATEDELPDLIERLNRADVMASEVSELH